MTDRQIAQHLQSIRQSRGLSQSKLSELSGIKLTTLQHLETGVSRILGAKLETVVALAQALDVTVEDLIEV